MYQSHKSLQSQRGGVFVDKPDIVKGSEKANNRSMVSLHELSEFSEIARYKVNIDRDSQHYRCAWVYN